MLEVVSNYTYEYHYDTKNESQIEKLEKQLVNDTNEILKSLLVIL